MGAAKMIKEVGSEFQMMQIKVSSSLYNSLLLFFHSHLCGTKH